VREIVKIEINLPSGSFESNFAELVQKTAGEDDNLLRAGNVDIYLREDDFQILQPVEILHHSTAYTQIITITANM